VPLDRRQFFKSAAAAAACAFLPETLQVVIQSRESEPLA
jgi:hypothetical protein